MQFRPIRVIEKAQYNSVVSHPLQSAEWGEFREKTGLKVIRRESINKDKKNSAFQLTIHNIPKIPWTIGYLPKGDLPNKAMLEELHKIGKENKCIFIQLEPNIVKAQVKNGKSENKWYKANDIWKIVPAAHPLFTKYTFILDLTKSEDELLKAMHPKARYNIKVAKKHGVIITEDNSDKAFEDFLRLTKETTTRQHFFAHTENYHRLQWETIAHTTTENQLTSHLLLAKYKNQTLAAWILFVFKDMLYYPYGASSTEHKDVMASNLMMWETIRFGKKLGLKKFDMWGALGAHPDPKDPWFGFHDFKRKYGPEHVELIGSYDLVINPLLYQLYKLVDRIRWLLLRIRK